MFEEHIVPFLERLRERYYARMTIRICRAVTQEFLIFLEGRVTRPEEISIDHLKAYLGVRARLFPHQWRRPMLPDYQERLADALNLFLRYLAEQGVRTGIPMRERQDLRAVPGYETLLADYQRFLRDHRGLQPGTIDTYLDHAARLCRAMVKSRTKRWEDLTPKRLYDHLRSQARRLGHVSLQNAQTALRSFFRFLHITGQCTKALDLYLVRYRTYRLSRVPRAVPLDDLYRIFEDVKGSSPADIRDRAVLLLLTLYGLRIGEIVRLKMDDVSWREQKFIVRRRKAGRDLVLPLHPAVARALWEYVDRVRPRGTPYREIFLSKRAPHPYPRGSNLAMTLRGRLHKLGCDFHPHAFRHALASQLINNNCPPEWIQQLLGHAQFVSTQVYAKVDLVHLREVAENDAVEFA
jgi:site-specific recombinase XerD